MHKYQTTKSIINIRECVWGILELSSLAMLIIVLAQTRQIDEIHVTMVPRIVDNSTTIEHHDIPQSIIGLDVVSKELQQREVTPSPHYVGIWGMGRVGKTLLAQKTYNSMEIQWHFQSSSFIWFMVGKTPHRKSLYQTLSKKLGLLNFAQSNDEDYKHEIYNVFFQKKIVFLFSMKFGMKKKMIDLI